ncbi:hypothetical protein ACO0K3_02735 [Undibacterium sp. Rencai35W]|uniref:hypothetical protein n=1 Tax=Undibacterium sp. Rencai35W TaxID=3413046 RepID=UPI003BF01EB0
MTIKNEGQRCIISLSTPIEEPNERVNYAWGDWTVHDYQSMWLTMHQLILLNRPTKKDFVKDFCNESIASNFISLDWFSTNNKGKLITSVDKKKMGQLLGVKFNQLLFSHLSFFSHWQDPFFYPQLRHCMLCLDAGYHTVFHSLKALDKCPIHNEEFVDKCLCGKPFLDRLAGKFISSPGACECGKMQLLAVSNARSPTIKNEEVEVFDQISYWLAKCKHRVFIAKPVARLGVKTNADMWRNICYWSEIAQIAIPKILSPLIHQPFLLKKTESIVYVSTIVRIETHPLNPSKTEKKRLSSIKKLPSNYGLKLLEKRPQNNKSVYKSISRYILKHILGNVRKWIFLFSSYADADYIDSKIRKNDIAAKSFALMLFWMHVEERVSLRIGFRWDRKEQSLNGFDLRLKLDREDLVKTMKFTERHHVDWVISHAISEILWSTWKSCLSKVYEMTTLKILMWGDQVIDEIGIVQWSAGYGSDERLRFRIERLIFPDIRPQPRVEKFERCIRYKLLQEKISAQKMVTFSVPCLTRDVNGVWVTVPGESPSLELKNCWLKRRKLFLPSGIETVNYFLFPDQYGYVARCIDLPIESRGLSSKEAINQLRDSVIFYKRIK